MIKKTTGISLCEKKFVHYTSWLESENIKYIILDYRKNNFDDIKNCSSLLLTGGADIYPEFYNDWDDGLNRTQYQPERDGFEFKLLDYALLNKLPVLGICRGMQLINCRLNGNLIFDIGTIRGTDHKKINDEEDRLHKVKISENSLLGEIIKESVGEINSSHHQAVDRLGEGLMISAKSPDGIIEGIEWLEKKNKAFLLGIQWHPERMKDRESPFVKNILLRFKEETER
jgi:putative glutamine amidotransferase